MAERALVSTHDLKLAGRLRSALTADDFRVELVTPGEDLSPREDAAILILTGGTADDEPPELFRRAHDDFELPVVAIVDDGQTRVTWPGLSELFARGTPPDEIALVVRRVVERHRLQAITGIVGESDAIREALERVVQIAPVSSTVLVTGESGTGKELVARGIHALSPRRHKPFIAVNVAALTDTLLESELFGHEKGAFTGAVDSRRGLFELADRGTIFLDEIGEMPLATQTKLLRVLEQREFLRVGGEKSIQVDVRIIAATNQDLRQLVATGEFRKDLYYRLNVLRIELPPLRERREDVPRLVHHFVREVVERNDRPFYGISDEAMRILIEHDWPGNIRELRNLVESMVVLAPGREIRPVDIPDEVRSPGKGRDLLPVPIARAERVRRSGNGSDEEGGASRQQMEFIFRTLVDLRMDMDDLRKEFDAYRSEVGDVLELGEESEDGGRVARAPAAEVGMLPRSGRWDAPRTDLGGPVVDVEPSDSTSAPDGEARNGEDGTVVFRPGMTMEEMEREAIAAALREVDGNRRKASDLLGIGERTLYRKIRKFGLDE